MKRAFFLVTAIFIWNSIFCGEVNAAAPTKAKWTIAVYGAVDEEEITHFTVPLFEQMMNTPLPGGVELLIQRDSHHPGEDMRFIRRDSDLATPSTTPMPEADSASPETLTDFVKWVQQASTGEHVFLMILAHSWGWKGILQDFTIPADPKSNTMMPLREFADVFAKTAFHPDVVFFDACVLGNVEAAEEFKAISRYLVMSQRETPYSSLPYEKFLSKIAEPDISVREFARALPKEYVSSFARGGSKAAEEGEYFTVTAVTLDMQNWDSFTQKFRRLALELKAAGFREFLRTYPTWPTLFSDMDTNFDIVEFLEQIGKYFPQASMSAQMLLKKIGYPSEVSAASAEELVLDRKSASEFKIYIQADELLKDSNEDGVFTPFPEILVKTWSDNNQDLALPKNLTVGLCDAPTGLGFERTFCVSGKLNKTLKLRPWLRGTREVSVLLKNRDGIWTQKTLKRAQDFFAVDEFPSGSPYLSEAHTQGLPFIHGLGVNFNPTMDKDEERSLDPVTGTEGPATYRQLRWSQLTGWGDLVLLNR